MLFFFNKKKPFFSRVRSVWEKRHKTFAVSAVVVIVTAILFHAFTLRPPRSFPRHSIVTIENGASLSQIADQLKEEGYIRSPLWFRIFSIVFRGERTVQAGDYFFGSPENTTRISKRMIRGEYGLDPIRVTIFEGTNRYEIADTLEEHFDKFNRNIFLGRTEEGRLFPDTYFFSPNVRAQEVARVMRENFENKITDIKEDIEAFGRPLDEILVMASILEEEAHTFESKRIISGILWRRIEMGMPLQVDAAFLYVNGRNTYELTMDDLRDDSPYNTYTRTGLPPTPITNPGLDSIKAAITPIETEYLFYLSDRSGNLYYAEDFEGHKQNRLRHL